MMTGARSVVAAARQQDGGEQPCSRTPPGPRSDLAVSNDSHVDAIRVEYVPTTIPYRPEPGLAGPSRGLAGALVNQGEDDHRQFGSVLGDSGPQGVFYAASGTSPGSGGPFGAALVTGGRSS